jgi:hypothetical protein
MTLTAPLTFILSRKGREEKKNLTAPFTLIISRNWERKEKENDTP